MLNSSEETRRGLQILLRQSLVQWARAALEPVGLMTSRYADEMMRHAFELGREIERLRLDEELERRGLPPVKPARREGAEIDGEPQLRLVKP